MVLEVGFSARLRSVAERAYFQTGLFPRGCRLMEDLELGSGQMWEKGSSECFLLGVSYC